MMRRKLHLALVVAAGLATSACEWYYQELPSPDNLWHVIPWFDHMIGSRAVFPYQSASVPRNTPAGAVPVSGGEPDWSAEWATGNTARADRLVNPLANAQTYEEALGGASTGTPGAPGAQGTQGPGDRHLLPAADVAVLPGTVDAKGDSLYQIYCTVCHGQRGAADGPVSPKIGAPSLLTERARGYSDGYLYSIIRYGRGVMPRYGDKVYSPLDRWAIVNHVRKLQRETPAPAAPAAAPAAAPTAGGTR